MVRILSANGLSVAILLLTSAAHVRTGAAQDIHPLTEEEFVHRFESWEPRFEQIKARMEGAHAEILAAKVLPNPTVSYDREQIFPSGGAQSDNFLQVELPIDISGARSQRIQAAGAGMAATQAETDDARFALILDGLDVYYGAAVARLAVETLHKGRGTFARLSETTEARTTAGDASGYDRGRLEIELATYDDLLAEAETRLAVARRVLGRLIGDMDAAYDATDPIAIPEPVRVSSDVIDEAIASRADYRAAHERLRQAEFELSAAKRAWIPRPSLSGGWKRSDTGPETGDGYTAGIGLTLPLFDHGQAERAAAEARQHSAAAQIKLLDWQIRSDIEAAEIELIRRIERAHRFEDAQLPRLDRLVGRAEASYREGEHTVFELLDAHRTARENQLRAIDLRHQAKRAELDLWRALGRRQGDGEAQ